MNLYKEARKFRREALRLFPGSVIAMRIGDFYEFFGPCVTKAAQVLGLTVSEANGHKLAGVPRWQAERYFQRLADAGIRVVTCEWKEPGLNGQHWFIDTILR